MPCTQQHTLYASRLCTNLVAGEGLHSSRCNDMQKLHAQHLNGKASVIMRLTASQMQSDVEHERWLHMSSATSCSTGKNFETGKSRLWSKESPVDIANPRTETPGTFLNTTFHQICDSDCQCPVWDTKTRLSKETHHFYSEMRNTESWGPV